MTTIKATCPSCGDVDLAPTDVLVTRAPAAGWATYGFTCPLCQVPVRKPADAEVVGLLRGAGVRMAEVRVPAEALEVHHGPALTYDDLLEFVLRLEAVTDLVGVVAQEIRR